MAGEDRTATDERAGIALGQTLASEPGAASDEAPRVLATGSARYVRGRELGRGGMGRVFEAIDQQFNRTVAVKEVSIDAPTPATMCRFTNEAIVTGHLEHPGVPSVYERGLGSDGRPFYAMRRVQGRTLARALADADTREKRLALLPVVTRVAQTVGFAHDRGVIHRDLKPENILVGDHGETFVLDWGLARLRGVPHDTQRDTATGGAGTLYGTVMGTPAYMAPEQASGDLDRVDERSDVFALGALLYHVLTGAAPYRGGTADELIDAARAARLRPIDARGLPRELVAICAKATARDPGERYRNAHELARALEGFEANAVLGRPSRTVNLTFDLIAIAAAVVMVFGTYLAASQVSPVSNHGPAQYVTYAVAVVGALASAVEWATRGRYRLSSLAFAFAFMTVLLAIAGFASGLSRTVDAAKVLDADKFRSVVSVGVYESIGGIVAGAMLAAVQLAMWAAARRRVRAGQGDAIA
jgi:hypothetical protein